MSERTISQEELFVVPRSDGTRLLYAPLRRSVAVVNEAASAAVATFLEKGTEGLSAPQADCIGKLRAAGLLGEEAPAHPVFPANYGFCPHEVTLFLTSRCNLRCRYCYAEAGYKAVDMPWEVARAAIDLVATNAGLLGASDFALGFHGGGEPTVAWPLLTRCVDYAREQAERRGLEAQVFCATNGLLNAAQREYIVQHFTTVNVSLDGPADIQDFYRPRKDGGGSFDAVSETLRYFDEHGFHYGVRATITSATVTRMVEIVSRLRAEFKIEELQMEPVWQCGRCLTTGERPPDDRDFIEHFNRAVRRGRELGVQVSYSGARLGVLTSKFCAASGDGFNVLPEGNVTSCYEVTEATDPKAALFHYGRFDPPTGAFVLDRDKIAALQQLSVEHLPFCQDCFCRWHCAGDCLSKAFDRSGTRAHQGTSRCNLNRSLMQTQLEELVAERSSAPLV
jgi:uncharacterized protein